jgi:hypothetical protein
MRGHNLLQLRVVDNLYRQIKLQVPRFVFLNRFSSGFKKPKFKMNYELYVIS